MKRIAQSAVALLLATGLAFVVPGSAVAGGMKAQGGGVGCCMDAR